MLYLLVGALADLMLAFREARRYGKARGDNEPLLLPGERGTPEANMPGHEREYQQLQYPENITISNRIYFLLVPTLVDQLTYMLGSNSISLGRHQWQPPPSLSCRLRLRLLSPLSH